MNLDKRRSALLNQAKLLCDAGSNVDQSESITIGALGSLGLQYVSPGRWCVAVEAFEQLALLWAAFSVREQELGPWTNDVETGVESPEWGGPLRVLAGALNSWIDFLLAMSDRVAIEGFIAPDDAAFIDSIDRVLTAKVKQP